MGRSVRRAVSVLAAGGVLTGTLLVGAGVASADTVTVKCGDSVTVEPGDTVVLTGPLGSKTFTVTSTRVLDGPLCGILAGATVEVEKVTAPVKSTVPSSSEVPTSSKAPATSPSTSESPVGGSGEADGDDKAAGDNGSDDSVAAGRQQTGGGGGGGQGQATIPGAPNPAFGSAFSSLPSSFLGSAAPGGLSPAFGAGFGAFGSPYDAGMLFGSAFPAVRGDLPFAAGYDAGDSVTSASRVQALPGDGIGDGLGLPVVLAVLILSGMAAFATRHLVARRAAAAGRS